ncbi:MAG TPA: FAD-dependent oxidoreductase [Candidatus Binataceae bacterium]|nr:FAD-dependent oxidoreductase [Candidatus Binataceae bacterium]
MSNSNDTHDKSLGLNQPICRRDFLNSTLLAAGGALLGPLSPQQLLADASAASEWTGYGGVGDYANSNGNTLEVMTAGHQIRSGVFNESLPADTIDTGEVFDCVIVGGGVSGLSAALFLQKYGGSKLSCLVLDNHPVFGGESKRNEFMVDGQRIMGPQGADHFQQPLPHSFMARFFELIGLDWRRFEYQSWGSPEPEIPLGYSFEDARGPDAFYFGAKFGQKPGKWLIDPYKNKLQGAPISEKTRTELLRYNEQPKRGLPFDYPGDEKSRQIDSVTIEQYLIEKYGLSQETIQTFMAEEGGGFGAGPDVVSAYCIYAFDVDLSMDAPSLSFPGGNAGIARHMVKTLIPDSIAGPKTLDAVCRGNINFDALDRPEQAARIRLDSTTVWVKHEGEPSKANFVTVGYTRGGKVYRVKARSVVMAGGCWTSKHVVRDLPATHREAYDQFYRSPCMMANVALRNWRFLYKMGISGCQWFEGLGSFAAIRKLPTFSTDQKTIGPDSPVVLTLKVLFPHYGLPLQEQGNRGRAQLLATPFRDYERQIRAQLTDMFSASGFDASRDVAGIILNRWGHAYVSPQPGFFFGKDGKPAPRTVLRAAAFGRIAFANTDLSGTPDHRTAIGEAHRAVNQLLDQVLV